MTPRHCAEPGCITILSSWNDDPHCFIHAPGRFGPGLGYRERQKRQAEIDCDERNCRHNVLDHEDRPMTDVEWDAFKRRRIRPWPKNVEGRPSSTGSSTGPHREGLGPMTGQPGGSGFESPGRPSTLTENTG